MIELDELPAITEPAPRPLVESAPGEKFISFEIGEQMFCVSAAAVQEVVLPINPAAVPLGPSWLLGLGALRGEPIAIIDPSTIATPARSFSHGKPKTIVFRSRINQTQFALPVDSLREMIVVLPEALKSGEFLHDGRPLKLIEHDQLFNSFEGNPS